MAGIDPYIAKAGSRDAVTIAIRPCDQRGETSQPRYLDGHHCRSSAIRDADGRPKKENCAGGAIGRCGEGDGDTCRPTVRDRLAAGSGRVNQRPGPPGCEDQATMAWRYRGDIAVGFPAHAGGELERAGAEHL